MRDRLLLVFFLLSVLAGVGFWHQSQLGDPQAEARRQAFLGRPDLLAESPVRSYLEGDFKAALADPELRPQAFHGWLYEVPFEWKVVSAHWEDGWLARLVEAPEGLSLQFFSQELERLEHRWKKPQGQDREAPESLKEARLEMSDDQLLLVGEKWEAVARRRERTVFLFLFEKDQRDRWDWSAEKFRFVGKH